MVSENKFLNAALDYIEKGFSVIPVKKDKTPYISWRKFQDVSPTKEEVCNWWTQYPDANIGVVVSKKHVVFDIDDAVLAEKVLNETLLEQTKVERSISNGLHIWFETETEVKTEDLRDSLGIKAEIRSYGTYIIVPPSDGYESLSDVGIVKVDNVKSFISQLLQDSSPASQIHRTTNDNNTFTEGCRNNELTSLAGTLFHKGFSKEVISETLQGINKRVCVPSLSPKEVASIVTSIGKAEKRKSFNVSLKPAGSEGKYYTLDEILKTSESEIDWIWKGFIGKGFITTLSSHPKMGKTTLLFHFLKAAKESGGFLGYPAKSSKKILILSEENKKMYAKRAKAFGLDGDNLLVMPSFDVCTLSWKGILEATDKIIEKENVELLIIDTLGAFWRIPNENEAPVVQSSIDELKILVQRRDIGCLALHHLRKAEGSHGTTMRGSTALMGAIDNSLEFQYGGTVTRRKITSHSRFEETPPEIIVERTSENVYVNLGTPASFEKAEVKKAFLEALTDEYEKIEKIMERLNTKPGASSLKAIASEVRKENPPIVDWQGKGVKRDPYQYRKLNRKSLS